MTSSLQLTIQTRVLTTGEGNSERQQNAAHAVNNGSAQTDRHPLLN